MLFGYSYVLRKILEGCYRCFYAVEKVSVLMGHLAGWAFLFLGFYITVDTLLRKYTTFSTKGHTEIGQYVLAAAVTWGASYALSKKSHIRIDVLLIRMPKSIQGYLNVCATGLLCGFLSYILWYLLTDYLPYTFRIDTRAATVFRTPLKIPQTIWTFGLFWLWLYSLLQLVVGLLEIALGNASKLAFTLGPPSFNQEINPTDRSYPSAK